MARGKNAKPGDTRIAANGYHYTRGEEKWILTHHLVAVEKLGRPLEEGERVSFHDNDRTNLSPENIKVSQKGSASLKRQLARLEARRDEMNGQIEELQELIALEDSASS